MESQLKLKLVIVGHCTVYDLDFINSPGESLLNVDDCGLMEVVTEPELAAAAATAAAANLST